MNIPITRFLRAAFRTFRTTTPRCDGEGLEQARLDGRFLDDVGLPRGPALALAFDRSQS